MEILNMLKDFLLNNKNKRLIKLMICIILIVIQANETEEALRFCPCVHYSRCVKKFFKWRCDCKLGYTGDFCNVNSNESKKNLFNYNYLFKLF